MKTPVKAEFVIVGAGVVGSGVAFELARRGRSVIVLEAAQIASGASGGPGKRGVRANGRSIRELPLMHRAHELWPRLAETLAADVGFEPIGHLELAERPDDIARLPERAALQREHGIPTEIVEGAALLDLEPDLAASVSAALFCSRDGIADHGATTRAYADAARRAGATFVEGARVEQLITDAGRVRSVVTADERRIEVDSAVIVAANQGTAELVAPLGAKITTFPVLPQALVTAPLAPPVVRHLIGHAHRRLALKSLPGGELMITGGWLGRWNAELGHGEVDPSAVAGNLAEASAVFPRLAAVAPVLAVADRVEAVSQDLVAIVDAVPGVPSCLYATGWTGHGWAIAPAVAEALAQWLLDGERPESLAPLASSRF